MEEAHFTTEDRKTLTQVETKLDRAIEDIRNLSNNFASKADLNGVIEKMKEFALKTELDDVKKQAEKQGDNQSWVVKGILGALGLALLDLFMKFK